MNAPSGTQDEWAGRLSVDRMIDERAKRTGP